MYEPWIQNRIANPSPDTDPETPLNLDPIRIRIRRLARRSDCGKGGKINNNCYQNIGYLSAKFHTWQQLGLDWHCSKWHLNTVCTGIWWGIFNRNAGSGEHKEDNRAGMNAAFYGIQNIFTKISVFSYIKGTVSWDRFQKCCRKWTDLGLNKGRGWFFNFSEAALIYSWNKTSVFR
jgi:hypothetical protein